MGCELKVHKYRQFTCMWGHEASRVGSSSSGSKSGFSLGGRVRKMLVQIWRGKNESDLLHKPGRRGQYPWREWKDMQTANRLWQLFSDDQQVILHLNVQRHDGEKRWVKFDWQLPSLFSCYWTIIINMVTPVQVSDKLMRDVNCYLLYTENNSLLWKNWNANLCLIMFNSSDDSYGHQNRKELDKTITDSASPTIPPIKILYQRQSL